LPDRAVVMHARTHVSSNVGSAFARQSCLQASMASRFVCRHALFWRPHPDGQG